MVLHSFFSFYDVLVVSVKRVRKSEDVRNADEEIMSKELSCKEICIICMKSPNIKIKLQIFFVFLKCEQVLMVQINENFSFSL